jgi:molecular chaperone GrpE
MQADTDPQQDADTPVDATEEASSIEETPSEQPNPEEAAEKDPWKELEADVAKWKEISLRTAAEMENLRKRTAREREEAIRYANQRLLEELLPVIDNFEMGMQAASEDTKSMIYIGMNMVRKQLKEFLSAQGVEEINTDCPFDPNFHEAVAQEDCAKGDEGRILRVTRSGYKIRDRLLRPASVIVSKLPNSAESNKDSKS